MLKKEDIFCVKPREKKGAWQAELSCAIVIYHKTRKKLPKILEKTDKINEKTTFCPKNSSNLPNAVIKCEKRLSPLTKPSYSDIIYAIII